MKITQAQLICIGTLCLKFKGPSQTMSKNCKVQGEKILKYIAAGS